jgi:hypothetical protein
MSDRARNTGPMLAGPRCGAKIRSGGSCRTRNDLTETQRTRGIVDTSFDSGCR